MSLFVNPTVSTLLDNQLANMSYLLRDSMRVSGEHFKLPQSVPNDRKIDYQFRHFHAVFYMAFLMELSFRLSDTLYTMPHFIDVLGLDKLKDLYKPGDFHLPKHIPASAVENITTKNFPSTLHSKMFGSLVNPNSYGEIADLLEHEIQHGSKKLPPAQIKQYQLWAHHFRRVLNPEQYLEKHIAPQISAAETKALTGQMKAFDGLSGKVSAALKAVTHTDAQAYLKAKHPNHTLSLTSDYFFEKAFAGGQSWIDLAKSVFKKGPSQAFSDYAFIKSLAKQSLMQKAKQQPSVAMNTLFDTLKTYLKDSDVKAASPFLQRVAKMKSSQDLAKLLNSASIGGMCKEIVSHGPQAAFHNYQILRTLTSSDEIMKALRKDILLPLAKKEHGLASNITHLFEDLSLRKLNLVKLEKIVSTGNFWVKMPINGVLQFLGYGLISNYIDNMILQPYQRKIVKERGDSTEFLVPGYMGAIPGMLTFGLLMKLPGIHRLGYVGSFVLSGLAGMAAYAGTTMALFYARLARPRNNASTAPAAQTLKGPRLTFAQQAQALQRPAAIQNLPPARSPFLA